jgi:hypothetical protein
MRRDPEVVAVPQENHSIIRRTKRDRRPDDGVENRLHNGRRATDDAQNLTTRRLLFQRLAQIVGALAQLIKQAAILDGDDGLIGEIRD